MAEATTFIAEVEATNATTQTLTFGTIPGTYDDLILMGSGRCNSTAGTVLYLDVNFNNDTTTGNYQYGWNIAYSTTNGYGSLIETNKAEARLYYPGNGSNNDASPGNLYMHLTNYANGNGVLKKVAMFKYGCWMGATSGAFSNWQYANIGYAGYIQYFDTTAITEIDLKTLFGYHQQGSKFSLYGLSNS
jgi:hypothetical protein